MSHMHIFGDEPTHSRAAARGCDSACGTRSKDTSWLSCVSYLVLPRLWLDVSQHPGDSSCHRENVGRRRRDLCDRPRLDRTCDADDAKWNLVLVLFSLRGGVSKPTVRLR